MPYSTEKTNYIGYSKRLDDLCVRLKAAGYRVEPSRLDDEWRNEHAQILSEILANSGITDTLSIDGREIPIESVTKAIRESFLAHRSKQLIQKLTDKVVTAAFKKVTEEENQLSTNR
jgi:hypothetical protein